MPQTLQQTDAETILNAIRQLAAMEETTVTEVLKRLDGIDKKLEKKIAYAKTQDTVGAFKEMITRKHRKPGQNYDYFLKEFNVHFSDRNMAEITPAEVEGFLYAKWGDKSGATWNQCKGRASSLFSFCIKELKRKGSPSFHNPCGLIDDVPVGKKERKAFIHIDKMKELLDTFTTPHHWLMYHILITSGLRIEELTCLRPMDIDGRILKIATYKNAKGVEVGPKSKRFEEYAVIPQIVADKLKVYMKSMAEDKPIFPYSHSGIRDVLETHARWVHLDKVLPLALRKWCVNFWEEKIDTQMMLYVLRETIGDKVAGYIKAMSNEEAMKKQDQMMVSVLFR